MRLKRKAGGNQHPLAQGQAGGGVENRPGEEASAGGIGGPNAQHARPWPVRGPGSLPERISLAARCVPEQLICQQGRAEEGAAKPDARVLEGRKARQGEGRPGPKPGHWPRNKRQGALAGIRAARLSWTRRREAGGLLAPYRAGGWPREGFNALPSWRATLAARKGSMRLEELQSAWRIRAVRDIPPRTRPECSPPRWAGEPRDRQRGPRATSSAPSPGVMSVRARHQKVWVGRGRVRDVSPACLAGRGAAWVMPERRQPQTGTGGGILESAHGLSANNWEASRHALSVAQPGVAVAAAPGRTAQTVSIDARPGE